MPNIDWRRIRRWMSLLLLGGVLGSIVTLASVGGEVFQAKLGPMDPHGCCRDLGYMQQAVIARIQTLKGEWRPADLLGAIERTGLRCEWVEDPAAPEPRAGAARSALLDCR